MSRLQKWLTETESVSDPSLDEPAPLEAPDGERYRDEGLLGTGATSIVRRLYDRVLQRHTAVKVLDSTEPRHRARFLREARLTALVEHPFVPPLHDWGTDEEGHDFIHLKQVSGQTLAERLDVLGDARLEPANLDGLIAVLVKLCDALSHAHSLGIVHRDVKPSNVMLGSFGRVYLLDWGIALDPDSEPSSTLRTVGTPAFMAPEQIEARDVDIDARADVYGLGAVLYTILTGRPPHQGADAAFVLAMTLAGRIRPPGEVVEDLHVPQRLSAIAMRALATDPDDRYPTIAAMQADLEAFARGGWHLPTRAYAAGTRIVEEGAPGDEAFLLLRGRCTVHTAAQGQVRALGPGDVFGEMAVLTNRPRSASVEALSDVVVQVVDRGALEEGLALDSWTGRFVQALTLRVAEIDAAAEE